MFKIKYLPYLIFTFFCTILIYFSKSDMWDSVLIEYAFLTNNFSGIKQMAFDSGWIFQYHQIILTKFLSSIFSIHYRFVNLIYIIISGILCINEIKFITKNIFKVREKFANIGLLIFSVFPIWHIFLSTILSYHFTLMTFGLLSVRLILLSKNKLTTFGGYLILIITYNLNSLMLFLPVLSYVYDIGFSDKKKPSLNTIIILIIAILEYIVYKYLSPPRGLYNGYNILNFNINSIILNSIINLTNLFPIFCLLFLLILLRKKFINQIIKYTHNKKFYLLCLLLISSVITYIIVGRSSNLFNIRDWNSRQIIILSTIITILYSIIIDEFNKIEPKLNYIFFILPIILFLQLTNESINKLNRQIFEKDLIILIKEQKNQIDKFQKIAIIGNYPKPYFRYYESNLLFYKALGHIDYATKISENDQKSFKLPDYSDGRNLYEYHNIYKYNSKLKGQLNMYIECFGYENLIDKIKNILHFKNDRLIKHKFSISVK